MMKKQQMRWSDQGAHRLLQLRVKVLNGELHQTFQQWYPGMKLHDAALPQPPSPWLGIESVFALFCQVALGTDLAREYAKSRLARLVILFQVIEHV